MESVIATFKVNVANAKKLLLAVIPRIAAEEWKEISEERQVNKPQRALIEDFCFIKVGGICCVIIEEILIFVLLFLRLLSRTTSCSHQADSCYKCNDYWVFL